MNRRRFVLLLATIFLLCPAAHLVAQKKIVVGILPTYDSSGQDYGGSVSLIMTGVLYQQFAGDPRFQPVFLDPGGLYDPTATSWVAEYAQGMGTPLDVIVATALTEPEMPKKGDLILHMRSVQLDPKTGDTVQTTVANTPLKDRSALINTGMSRVSAVYVDASAVYQPSRNFIKQPLGRASIDLARQSVEAVAQSASKLTASGLSASSNAASCKMSVRINYVEKHAISKSYNCIINEKDETLGIKEGILEVEEPAAPVLMQIKLNDAPYKLPKQELYLFDPTLDCSRGSNRLEVNIGPAGEASYKWK